MHTHRRKERTYSRGIDIARVYICKEREEKTKQRTTDMSIMIIPKIYSIYDVISQEITLGDQ